ncbi:transposase [Usitatibacter rugosus]|uniref:transposase n=1 Tax=Usitatibacter rugosus TaxID=2732067 RepID=UPI001BB245C6|nr:transposase [Usitatibacter rugosus]
MYVPGVPNHVIVRGNNRQAIFGSEGDRIFFHRCLAERAPVHGVSIHAYVMMTNHVHLLATGSGSMSISRLMQSIGRRYVGYYNHQHDRTGTLWEGRHKSIPVETDRHLVDCQRYIELNPVRAGIVKHPADYPWSSHRHFAFDKPDTLVTPHELIVTLGYKGERTLAYRSLFEEDLDAETLQKIRSSVQKGWALGSDAFCKQLESLGGRRAQPRRRGPKPVQPALDLDDPNGV